jgi:uncharacterized protein (TIGR03066 family)
MKALCAAVLGLSVVVFAGTARAEDDNAKKIVGVWEVTKSDSEIPTGSTVEFLKDGKLNVVIKDNSGDMKFSGTYKIEKDKISLKLQVNDMTHEETVTIKKLTDDALEVEDKDKKVDIFKKKK